MKKGRWYLVYVFEDRMAHPKRSWPTRTIHHLLKAVEPDAAYKEGMTLWEKKQQKDLPRTPNEKGPLKPLIIYAL